MIMGEDSKIDVDEQELEISLSKSSFGTSSPIATVCILTSKLSISSALRSCSLIQHY